MRQAVSVPLHQRGMDYYLVATHQSALCQQSGEAVDDVLTCAKGTVLGQHVCFINGGAGNDQINLQLGTETTPVDFKGVVDYFADTGAGDDAWNAIVHFTDVVGLVNVGAGSDTYVGPPPVFLTFPISIFEVGV